MGAFKLSKTKTGKFTFQLIAPNGQIILFSDPYDTKDAAEAGIRAVAESAQTESNFERRATNHGDYYFVLKGSSGRVLAKSEEYASQAGRENGIWSVRKNSETTKIMRPQPGK